MSNLKNNFNSEYFSKYQPYVEHFIVMDVDFVETDHREPEPKEECSICGKELFSKECNHWLDIKKEEAISNDGN